MALYERASVIKSNAYAAPLMKALRGDLAEPCRAAVPRGSKIICVAREPA